MGVRRGDLAHAQGPEDARLHVRLEGHGERAAGGLRASCREGGLGLEGVRQADEEGPSLPCRGVLSGPLRIPISPCTLLCTPRSSVIDLIHSFILKVIEALRMSALQFS